MKKEFRIKKTEDIELLIKNKDFYNGKYLVLYIKENHDLDHFHYALSVSKKSGDAVTRNLFKRRIRSVIRELNIKNSYEFFVMVKKSVNDLPYQTIKEELTSLLTKSKLLEN